MPGPPNIDPRSVRRPGAVLNPRQLRVIKTARTEDAINAAAREGFRPLIKAVQPGKGIHFQVIVLQHRDTGEIKLEGDNRFSSSRKPEWNLVEYIAYYPYQFPSPFAAYLIPPDLKEGEVVWLEDIIEDILAVYGNQGYHPRLEAWEATWRKGDFQIHFNPRKDAPIYKG